MSYEQLPAHWRTWIEQRSSRADNRLSASDFPRTVVHLRFEDGSEATFRYAFFVEDPAQKELAVFTEHCGYHVFALQSLETTTTEPML